MSEQAYRFPFGRPVRACSPSACEPRRVFVLGAYPSALHLRWVPPKPWKEIRAIAVDNEPTPFWTGHDEVERIDAWKLSVRWSTSWGTVFPVGRLNGSSGAWLTAKVFAPLKIHPSEAWITDCLDTYRASVGAAERLVDTYRPFAASMALPVADTLPHPSEGEIPGLAAMRRQASGRRRRTTVMAMTRGATTETALSRPTVA